MTTQIDQQRIDEQFPYGAPGSDKAVKAGCTCPVMDNGNGLGIMALGKDWWITLGCPVHSPQK